MHTKKQTKIVKEGHYLAEVDVDLLDTGESWSPYLTLEDANKLDEVRKALKEENIKKALKLAKVFILQPVAI